MTNHRLNQIIEHKKNKINELNKKITETNQLISKLAINKDKASFPSSSSSIPERKLLRFIFLLIYAAFLALCFYIDIRIIETRFFSNLIGLVLTIVIQILIIKALISLPGFLKKINDNICSLIYNKKYCPVIQKQQQYYKEISEYEKQIKALNTEIETTEDNIQKRNEISAMIPFPSSTGIVDLIINDDTMYKLVSNLYQYNNTSTQSYCMKSEFLTKEEMTAYNYISEVAKIRNLRVSCYTRMMDVLKIVEIIIPSLIQSRGIIKKCALAV